MGRAQDKERMQKKKGKNKRQSEEVREEGREIK